MWQMFTMGGGTILPDLFNGVASMAGGGFIASASKVAALVGLIWVIMRQVFGDNWTESFKWFAGMMIAFNALFLPTVSVTITDRLQPSNPGTVVDNVPFALGAFAAMTSQAGDAIATKFETAFTLPDDLTYQKNGMLFGNALLAAMRQIQIPNAEFAGNIREYMYQCVFLGIQLGQVSVDDLSQASNIWTFITSSTVATPSRSMQYTSGGVSSIVTCQDAANFLSLLWPNITSQGLTLFGKQMYPGITEVQANALLLSALPTAHEFLIGVSRDAAGQVQQAMLINAINDALVNLSASSNNSAALQAYAQARAESQTQSAYQAIARQAQTWVPILRTVLEALFVGIFPLVIVLVMLPSMGPKILINYLMALVWLQSWPPIYAILNRLMANYTASQLTSLGSITDGSPAMTLATQAGIGAVVNDVATIAGSLAMLIPFLAMAIVRGAAGLVSLSTSVLHTAQAGALAAAHEASTGNFSLGNTSFDNHSFHTLSGYQSNTAPSIRSHSFTQDHGDGRTTTYFGDGRSVVDVPESRAPFSADLARMYSSELRGQAREAQASGRSEEQTAAQFRSAAVGRSVQFASSMGRRLNELSTIDREAGTSLATSVAKVTGTIDDAAGGLTISKDRAHELADQILANAEARATASGGLSFLGTGATVSAETSVGHNLADRIGRTDGERTFVERLSKATQSEDFRQAIDSIQRDVSKQGVAFTSDEGQSLSQDIRSNMEEGARHESLARAHFEQSRNLERTASSMESASAGVRESILDPFRDHMKSRGHDVDRLLASRTEDDRATIRRELGSFVRSRAEAEGVRYFNPNVPSALGTGMLGWRSGDLSADFQSQRPAVEASAPRAAAVYQPGVDEATARYSEGSAARLDDTALRGANEERLKAIEEAQGRINDAQTSRDADLATAKSNYETRAQHFSGAKYRQLAIGDDALPKPNIPTGKRK